MRPTGAAANGTITFTLEEGRLHDERDRNRVATRSRRPSPGDGDYQTSGFEPDVPGDYHWQASYDGSSPNTLAPPTHNTRL